jgi:hypothetical protein
MSKVVKTIDIVTHMARKQARKEARKELSKEGINLKRRTLEILTTNSRELNEFNARSAAVCIPHTVMGDNGDSDDRPERFIRVRVLLESLQGRNNRSRRRYRRSRSSVWMERNKETLLSSIVDE